MRKSIAVLLLALSACTGATPDAPVVRTDHGMIRGTDHGDHRTYQGIPYAAPPTRWKPPEPARPWNGTRDATRPPPSCAQAKTGGPGLNGSEDCLYLNVTEPANDDRNRPVMVWLHGGGFTYGTSTDYDGRRLATRGNTVVVTVNYRLGIFGFLGGNFGLADQAAALRWVRANATAFGGDPRNVTLFGESAGGMSVCSHLTSPASEGLFDKAIIESGSCLTEIPRNGIAPGVPAYRPWWPKDQVATMTARTLRQLGCGDLACLRAKPTAELATTDLMSRFSFPGFAVGDDPATALRAGRFHRVPVLQGSNRDEMRFYVAPALAAGLTIDEAKYDELLADSFGPAAPRVRAVYPPKPTPALAWATLLTDAGWSCTTLEANRALAAYGYEFGDRTAPNAQRIPTDGFPLGAAHGTELAYLFPGPRLSPDQQELSDRMVDAWTRFARRGDPGWPRYPHVEPLAGSAADHHCELWRTI
ncbi:carboxylesterase/lipase family protein [Cryptosporangium arvum]|uniref:carboxylesterase/lipase family protein n=1 Tax=Cryptosporangium arvum TaxID=80871 RepID=UPI0004B10B90|nr:carboxylesterase family protein [Cryptosporangium arvum]